MGHPGLLTARRAAAEEQAPRSKKGGAVEGQVAAEPAEGGMGRGGRGERQAINGGASGDGVLFLTLCIVYGARAFFSLSGEVAPRAL